MNVEELFVSFESLPNYAVSNYGRVINITTGQELKPWKNSKGHLQVTLHRNGLKYKVLVKRFVARAFFLNYEEGVEVHLINGNKEDCTVLNISLGPKPCRQGEALF